MDKEALMGEVRYAYLKGMRDGAEIAAKICESLAAAPVDPSVVARCEPQVRETIEVAIQTTAANLATAIRQSAEEFPKSESP